MKLQMVLQTKGWMNLRHGNKKFYEFYVDANDCFICTSHKKGKWGHAMAGHNGRTVGVYRHIYEECFGEIPEGIVIRHRCDNGACINPYHLELGTDKENKEDMVKRGRSRKGEKHHNVKVTEELAYFIKNNIEYTAKELSEIHGVSVRQIMRIRSGERWSHIDTVLPLDEIKKLREKRQYESQSTKE